ncbi:hypothetical protein PVK06_011093 [Gossypium arboreum]|uniref:Uncharacterized protein n=1 Tax=Gossypium arboreum TaxID=29729 RepID=A0ABR0Q7W6_GOSAR|nr:hypothetical protein PVK06_011093 [Gossypium arboreum]
MSSMFKSKGDQVGKRSTLKKKRLEAGMKEGRSKKETIEKRSIHNALTTRRPHTWRNIVGSSNTFNREPVNNLDIRKEYVKTKDGSRMCKLKLLMEIRLRRNKC